MRLETLEKAPWILKGEDLVSKGKEADPLKST